MVENKVGVACDGRKGSKGEEPYASGLYLLQVFVHLQCRRHDLTMLVHAGVPGHPGACWVLVFPGHLLGFFSPPSLGLFHNLFCTHNVCMTSATSELKHP